MSAETRASLAQIIAEVTRGRVGVGIASQPEAVLLAGNDALDSVEMLEIVVLIEERLGVSLTSTDLTQEHWRSLDTLVGLVSARRG